MRGPLCNLRPSTHSGLAQPLKRPVCRVMSETPSEARIFSAPLATRRRPSSFELQPNETRVNIAEYYATDTRRIFRRPYAVSPIIPMSDRIQVEGSGMAAPPGALTTKVPDQL